MQGARNIKRVFSCCGVVRRLPRSCQLWQQTFLNWNAGSLKQWHLLPGTYWQRRGKWMEHRTDMGPAHVESLQGSSQTCSRGSTDLYLTATLVGPDSSVGVATPYRLNGLGIESRWGGQIFRTCPDRSWRPPNNLFNKYRVFPGDKVAGAWPWPPTSSSAEVKERVQLYFYSLSRHSWHVLGWTLPVLTVTIMNSVLN